MSVQRALVENNDIISGDDAICIKSGRDAVGRAHGRPADSIRARNNLIRSASCPHVFRGLGDGCGALKVGTEMSGGVHGVRVVRNTFGLGAQSVARIKSAPGRGGTMTDLVWEDNVARGTVVAVSVQMAYKPGPPENASSPGTPHLTGLAVRNLTGFSLRGGELLCLAESPCSGIELANITLTAALGWTCEYAHGRAEGVKPAPNCLAAYS